MFHDAKEGMVHRALKEASLLIGSEEKLCKRIKMSRSQYSNCLNRGDKHHYDSLVRISIHSRISIKRLSPDTEDINSFFVNPGLPIKVSLKNLVRKALPYLEHYRTDRLMIVGTNRWLISGSTQKNSYDAKGMKDGLTIALDLEALLLEMETLQSNSGNFDFLISERLAICFCLKQLLSELQDKWTSLYLEPKRLLHYSKLYQNQDEIDKRIAAIVGFNDMRTFYCLEQAYLSRDKKLLEAIDSKRISMGMIEKVAKLSKKQLMKVFQDWQELCTE